jgi:hypothetical protein
MEEEKVENIPLVAREGSSPLIPVMEPPKPFETVKQPEMTEEQKREAHIMFHELLKTQADPLVKHVSELTNQVNKLTEQMKK